MAVQAPKPNLRSLYWVKLGQIDGTIWGDLEGGTEEGGEAGAEGELTDLKGALEELFKMRAAGRAPVSAAAKSNACKVLPLSRANNVAIMLTQFKMPQSDVRRALMKGGEGIGLERLALLLQMAPSDDEVRLLRGFKGPVGDLSPPEAFLSLLAAVPRIRPKLQTLLFARQFDSRAGEMLELFATVRRACEQVQGSPRLKRVLRAVLHVGNTLNQGTARGNAQGLRLESLMKLADVKSTVPSGALPKGVRKRALGAKVKTLLDFVVAALIEKEPEGGSLSAALLGELADVRGAARHTHEELEEMLRSIGSGIAAASREHRAAEELSRTEEEKGRGDSAEEEGQFANYLAAWVEAAKSRQEALRAEAASTQDMFTATAVYLGEPADQAAPEMMFGILWEFCTAIERAERKITGARG